MMRIVLIISGFILMLSSTSCARRVVVQNQTSDVVIVKRPAQYTVVHVNGNRYYKWNGRLHRKTRRGYVVVRR